MTDTLKNDVITHYYWIISDWAYLGADRLNDLPQKYGVQIDHRPVRLLNVYRETGGTPLPQRSKERQNYRFEEMKRWRDRLNMPLILEPTGFPHPDELASCLVYALKSTGADVGQLSARIMTALWAEDKDISNPDVLTSICDELGLDAQALLQIARHKDTIAHYDANTQSAIKDGVFGSPFYIYKGQRFWGQDRLDFLEELVVRHV